MSARFAAERATGRSSRAHPAFWAFVVHRLSGLGLALFLPFHFLMLGTAIRGEAALDDALAWTDNALVKAAETGLVMLLAVHLAGGIRLLVIEGTGGRRRRAWIGWVLAFALVVGVVFVLGLIGV